MTGVLLFAGTTEGRELAKLLVSNDIKVHVCVATEYGKMVVDDLKGAEISVGSLGMDGMCQLMKEYPLVIDSTHPYAVTITDHIKEACDRTGSEYIRLIRPVGERSGMTVVDSIDSAVEYLKGTEGNILVTTGSKEVAKYTSLKDRAFVRVLPTEDSLRKCIDAGFEGNRILCMQGPFSEEMDLAMLRQIDARFIVTKDSGIPGGFMEKVNAAESAGVEMVLVGRPTEESGMTYSELLAHLKNRFSIKEKRVLYVVGVGMGTVDSMTTEAVNIARSADLVAGAARMVSIPGMRGDILEEYASDKILTYLDEHQEYRSIAVLVSGDIGFYSAADKLIRNADPSEFEVRTVCGISSVVYMCGRMMIPWQDAFMISAHGRDANIIGAVKTHEKVFSLLQGSESARSLCDDLCRFDMDNVMITIGQDLGCDNEKLISGHPSEIKDKIDSKLCVAIIMNDKADRSVRIGIPDDELIRGDAPMTKSEVRALSVLKLKLNKDSVVYDVGAGTGSVSVEMALSAVDGKVFAIEKEEEATELIEKNRIKFAVPNLMVVKGYAPEALEDLPVPTHVFIGGSSGNLKSILKCVLKKNPNVRIVINSVTVETMAETFECIKDLALIEEDTVCINVSRSRKLGSYHLMTAQNPVYIVTCRGPGQ